MNRAKQNRLHRKKRGIDMNQCAAAKKGDKAYELDAAFCLLMHKLRRTSSVATCWLYEYPNEHKLQRDFLQKNWVEIIESIVLFTVV